MLTLMLSSPLLRWWVTGAGLSVPGTVRISGQAAVGAGLAVRIAAVQSQLRQADRWRNVELLLLAVSEYSSQFYHQTLMRICLSSVLKLQHAVKLTELISIRLPPGLYDQTNTLSVDWCHSQEERPSISITLKENPERLHASVSIVPLSYNQCENDDVRAEENSCGTEAADLSQLFSLIKYHVFSLEDTHMLTLLDEIFIVVTGVGTFGEDDGED